MNFIYVPLPVRLVLIVFSLFLAYEQNNFKLWKIFHKNKAFKFFYNTWGTEQYSISRLNWILLKLTVGIYYEYEWEYAKACFVKTLQDALENTLKDKDFQKLPPKIYNLWMDSFFELKKEAESRFDCKINLKNPLDF